MEPHSLPPGVLAKILSFADGETLLVCKRVSPMFRDIVSHLTKATDIWKKCLVEELAPSPAGLSRFLAKLYPHVDDDDENESTVNWEYVYTRCRLTQLTTFPTECAVSATKVGTPSSKAIHNILVHGDLILTHVRYNKNLSLYSKVKTIDLTGEVVDTSCRFDLNSTLYVTPVNCDYIPDRAVLLYCNKCNLVGIPICDKSGGDEGLSHNGDVVKFDKLNSLVSKCNLKVESCQNKLKNDAPDFLHSPSHLHSSELPQNLNAWTELGSEITCTKVWGHLIFMGTDTGKLYSYTWKDGNDIRDFKLKNYIWSFDVSNRCILSIDVMITESQFRVVCCDVLHVFSILLNDWMGNQLICV